MKEVIRDKFSDIKKALSPYFKGHGDVLFAYLFGSCAREETTSLSDIDIAVYLKRCDFEKERIALLVDICDILKRDDVDLVILNKAPLPLTFRIIRDRKILADNAPFIRHAFESLTIRMYLDFSILERRILYRRYLSG